MTNRNEDDITKPILKHTHPDEAGNIEGEDGEDGLVLLDQRGGPIPNGYCYTYSIRDYHKNNSLIILLVFPKTAAPNGHAARREAALDFREEEINARETEMGYR